MKTTAQQAVDWQKMLSDAVNVPGVISEAYRRFWNYSTGNQILAMVECTMRELPIGPIHTYKGWQELGRQVRKGEKAIALVMPFSCKSKERKDKDGNPEVFTMFGLRNNWFVLAQTDGAEYVAPALPEWTESAALAKLNITRCDFAHTNGNAQGYAIERRFAVSPIAANPLKTTFHELAHIVMGHTTEGQLSDDEKTPKNICEVEAESVALICCESLGLPGADCARGYIQHWLRGKSIPDRSIQRIFKAADTILKAGRA